MYHWLIGRSIIPTIDNQARAGRHFITDQTSIGYKNASIAKDQRADNYFNTNYHLMF